jgi:antitoxin FitA
MASITIRNLDDGVKRRLRIRAAENGRSMEEEARTILETGVAPRPGLAEESKPFRSGGELWDSIRARFAPLGGMELEPFPDGPVPDPPDFDK